MKTIYRKILYKDLLNLEQSIEGQTISSKYDPTNDCIVPTNVEYTTKTYPNLNYGKINKPYIYITISLNQNIYNIGILENIDFIANTNISNDYDVFDVRNNTSDINQYLTTEIYLVSGQTESRLDEIDVYGDINVGVNYNDDGFTGIVSQDTVKTTYYINADDTLNGIKYDEYSNLTTIVFDNITKMFKEIPLVNFLFSGQGYTDDNFTYQSNFKTDYLLGISEVTTTNNELELLRSTYSVFEPHYILGEINSFESLVNYKNNYFNLNG